MNLQINEKKKKIRERERENKEGLIGFRRSPAEWNHLPEDNPLTFRILKRTRFQQQQQPQTLIINTANNIPKLKK